MTYVSAFPIFAYAKLTARAAKDSSGTQTSTPPDGYTMLFQIDPVRFTAYSLLIFFASSMISKAYFCLPWANSFL